MNSFQSRPDAPSLLADANRCVRCGLCLPHCPTFNVHHLEAESPRGRVVLAEALAHGSLTASSTAPDHLQRCLSCGHCERVCPARVPVTSIVAQARHLLGGPNGIERRVLNVLARPRFLAAVMGGLRWLQRTGLPRSISPALAALPKAGPAQGARSYPACGAVRGRLLLLPGCVATHLGQDTHAAAIQVLTRLGFTVKVPAGPACCGTLHRHFGDGVRGEQLWQRATMDRAHCDVILIAATGCSSGVPDHVVNPSGTRVPVRDLCDFLAEQTMGPLAPSTSRKTRILLHLPCTRRGGRINPDAETTLLRDIPGLEVAKATAGMGCCGAAGTHFLRHRELAGELATPLLEQARTLQPDYIVSSNIGCSLHLRQQLLAAGLAIPIIHPVRLLAERIPA